jgi:site-specific DNA-methyltransferase (adenine-specific)/site-specific DNA-methyltransferase (cytosine-N4-specific)
MKADIVPLDSIEQDPRNANKHSERGEYMVRRSMERFGYAEAGTLDKNNKIIGGNLRTEIAHDVLDATEAIVIDVDGTKPVYIRRPDIDLDTADGRELAYALNRSAQVSIDFDPAVIEMDLAAGLDLGDWFKPTEIELMFDGTGATSEEETADAEPQFDRADALMEQYQTTQGQAWQLGRNVLICGDCRDSDTWERLLGAAGVKKANSVFTSPPYAEQREEQYGGIPAGEYVDWWELVQDTARKHIEKDGSFFLNIKPHSEDGERSLYVTDLVTAMVRRWQWSFVDEFCWLRSGVPRQVKYSFKNGFEPVYHFAATQKGFKFRPEAVRHESDSVPIPGGPGVGNTNWAGKQGKKQYGKAANKLQGHTSWIFGGQEYAPGLAYPSNVIKSFSNDETRGHEAAFPPQLPEFFIKAYSDEGDAWIDPFSGSGTTIMAAQANGRRGLGIELLPKYVAVTIQRWVDATGGEPVLIQS